MRQKCVRILSMVCAVLGMGSCIEEPLTGPKAVSICGRVDLDAPVTGATVVIQESTSGADLWQGTTTNGHFQGHTSTEAFAGAGKDLLFSASGGAIEGKPFTGTLCAYIPAYVANDHIEINLLTTLIAVYKQAWGVSYERARRDVFDYFKIPRDFDLLNTAHQANSRAYFDPARYLEYAKTFGGPDAYLEHLATNEIGLVEGRSFGGLYYPEEAGAAKSAVTEMGAALGKSIMSTVGTKAAGLILSYFGFQGTDDQLAGINTKLDAMQAKLDTITDDLTTLQATVNATLTAVNLSRDQVIGQIAGYNISEPQNIINNQYGNLMSNFQSNAPHNHTQQGQQDALNFSNDMLEPSGYDIDQRLADLHSGIIGGGAGTTGFLDAVTNVAIDQVAGGKDLLNAYLAMESYFSELMAIEGKGLILMTEALNYQQGVLTAGTAKRFTGTADQFLTKYQGYMALQVDKFLTCVDRLVVSKFNVVTDLAAPVQVVPDNTGTIYKRADFLAQLICPQNHPAGLILRIVGTPTDVRNLVAAGPYTKDELSWIFCPYKAAFVPADAAKTGSGCSGSFHTTTTVTPFSGVDVDGNSINLYAANLPADHTLGQYYEWASSSSTVTCRLQSQVAVAKLALGTASTSSSTGTCYDCDFYDGEGADESWSLEPGLQASLSGKVSSFLTLYDDTFAVSSTGTPYANVLIVKRSLPPGSVWSTTQAWADPVGGNQMSAAFDPNSMKVTTSVALSNMTYSPDMWDPSDTYYYWPVNNSVLTSASFTAATADDAAGKMCVGAQASLIYTTSYGSTIGLNGTLSQWTKLDAAATATTKQNIANATNASAEDTGSLTVSAALQAGVGKTVSLSQQILDGSQYRVKPTVTLGTSVTYSHFRIYPVAQ